MKNAYIYETKIGNIFIAEDEYGITDLALADVATEEQLKSKFEMLETEQIMEAAGQLVEYLEGSRKEFTLTLHPIGTQFQRLVWEALREIPYGETRSYKQVAEAIGNPKASRAVGMANHNNPIMCIVPCHRVIGSNGSMVGYAGGIQLKELLLNLEKGTERNI